MVGTSGRKIRQDVVETNGAALVQFFFFKQKTAYELKECDWSSDVCSSDLLNIFLFDREYKVFLYF